MEGREVGDGGRERRERGCPSPLTPSPLLPRISEPRSYPIPPLPPTLGSVRPPTETPNDAVARWKQRRAPVLCSQLIQVQAGRSHQKFHYRDARFLPLKALTPLTPSARRRSAGAHLNQSPRVCGRRWVPTSRALVTIPPRLMHSYHCLEIWAAARVSWLKGSATGNGRTTKIEVHYKSLVQGVIVRKKFEKSSIKMSIFQGI